MPVSSQKSRCMVDHDALAQQFEAEFPFVDGSLIRSTLSDYEGLSKQEQVRLVRETLSIFQDAAMCQDTAGFDPTGLGSSTQTGSRSTPSSTSYAGDDAYTGPLAAHKGVDGFAEGIVSPRGKGKKKHNRRSTLQTRDSSSSDLTSTTQLGNVWQRSGEDIHFIASRTAFPAKSIASLYEQCGRSRSKTIAHLVGEFVAVQVEDLDDDTVICLAIELTEDNPALQFPEAIALVNLTKDQDGARQLGRDLASEDLDSIIYADGPIVPEYEAIKLSHPSRSPSPSPSAPRLAPSQLAPGQDSKSIRALRDEAFNKSRLYARRSKSDHYMAHATSYYSNQAREYNAAIKKAELAERERFAAAQTSKTELDLHDFNVSEATRLARERVEAWWEGLGERRLGGMSRGNYSPYKIIVGLGNHSTGGRAKVGPAVERELRKGWKVEREQGVIWVFGKK
ncbi:hypothetical protein EJ06DRAFT_583486 [Trichodelitschia bisporula]|uniref:Smr domain-containing protein n=1 Tax=Trichodelitschia bisporula TaxID=703511 RepID=A0A6G1HT10_9PEZI|nr:hypothetical protein EJ06DRAFT_583486 [Trichodelitschia bisporula]